MTDWRTLGPVHNAMWDRELFQARSPLYAVKDEAYEAAGDHTALCLAMMREESTYGTRFNRNVAGNRNILNLRPPDGNGYMGFDGWVDGVRAWHDRLLDPTYKSGIYGRTRTIPELVHVYAPDSDGNSEQAYVAGITASLLRWGVTPQEVQPSMSELRIILNPGHRNSTGGNDEEQAMTPALAQSYFEAFTKAGYETVNLGDTNGGLDETCRRMAAMIASAPGKCVLLDLHYEGSPAPGVFCIIPDVTGLTTNAPVPQDPNDTWDGNGDDRLLAIQISARIAEETGLQLRRGIRFPGMMDESETGVGADGWRLATFAYTSPYRTKAVRLVVEHGNHTVQPDRSIIMQPDFTDKCAAAAVAAVNAVYGGAAVPEKPKYATPLPIPFKQGELGWRSWNGNPAYLLRAKVEIVRDTTPLAWADGDESDGEDAPPAGKKLRKGDTEEVWISTANKNAKDQTVRWLIRASDNARIIGSSCRPLLPFKQ